ncbi:hypothetical protein QFC19_002875 [Naganishia cerealis]|uniref:Uncharacterized protein n=1 Tax=Naganishia cerealis TaxID=610337 RepID=A0ACC2W7E3_9TREE|nr:hypothetical protein QFC19_002875 [Naganishia cerealis]
MPPQGNLRNYKIHPALDPPRTMPDREPRPTGPSGPVTVTVPRLSVQETTWSNPIFHEFSNFYQSWSTTAPLSRVPPYPHSSPLDKGNMSGALLDPTLETQRQTPLAQVRLTDQYERLRRTIVDVTAGVPSALGISLPPEESCHTSPPSIQSPAGTSASRRSSNQDNRKTMQENLEKARVRLAYFSSLYTDTKGRNFSPASLATRVLQARLASLNKNDPIFAFATEIVQVNPHIYQLLLLMTLKELRNMQRIYNTAKAELGGWLPGARFPAFLEAEDERPYPLWKKQGDAEYFAGWMHPMISRFPLLQASPITGVRVYHDLIEAVFAGQTPWSGMQRVLKDWDFCVIRPADPSRQPPSVRVEATVAPRSTTKSPVGPAPSLVNPGRLRVTSHHGTPDLAIPAAAAVSQEGKGKGKVLRLADIQSSAQATSSPARRANAVDGPYGVDRDPRRPSVSVVARQVELSVPAQTGSRSVKGRQRSGSSKNTKKRRPKGELIVSPDNHSPEAGATGGCPPSTFQSLTHPSRRAPEPESKADVARREQGVAREKLDESSQVQDKGKNAQAKSVPLPVLSSLATGKSIKKQNIKVSLPRQLQLRSGKKGKKGDSVSRPPAAVSSRPLSSAGTSVEAAAATATATAAQPLTDLQAQKQAERLTTCSKESNTWNEAQLKHPVGLRVSCSNPELGELDIVGPGFKDCFPHLQLCDYDPRYSHLWQSSPMPPEISKSFAQAGDHSGYDTGSTISFIWDDMQITLQESQTTVSERFLQTIRGNSLEPSFDQTNGSPASPPSASALGLTLFAEPGSNGNVAHVGEIASSNTLSFSPSGLNPHASVFTPTIVHLALEKKEGPRPPISDDDGQQDESTIALLTPSPHRNEIPLVSQPSAPANTMSSSPSGLLSPSAREARGTDDHREPAIYEQGKDDDGEQDEASGTGQAVSWSFASAASSHRDFSSDVLDWAEEPGADWLPSALPWN